MPESSALISGLKEVFLAISMILIIVVALWQHTGSMPPLVVVESSSMIHEKEGEIGSIDAGDLILVHNRDADHVITFAEASDKSHPSYGHESHGMYGDVIIFNKNGEDSTPIIHRAILKAVANQSVDADENNCDIGSYDAEKGICILTWDVPGTYIRNVTSINLTFNGENDLGLYICSKPFHGSEHLTVIDWKPQHEGFMTLGDNNNCNVDQGREVNPLYSGISGYTQVVGAVKSDWLVGVAGGEIPWLGVVKLFINSGDSPGVSYVPNMSFIWLFFLIGGILVAPNAIEFFVRKSMLDSPEIDEYERELATSLVIDHLQESE